MIPAVSEKALILAPRGRDAQLAAAMLAEVSVNTVLCGSVAELAAALSAGAGFAVLADEALRTSDLRALSAWVAAQPEWSDFPFILLTERGGGLERNPAAQRHQALLGNVTFIERPFHPTTLISAAQSALRGRRRQYNARAQIEALHESERQFRTLADSIPTLCWMAEPDGHIFWYNQRWYDFTGATPEAMEGWGWQSVHDPVTLPAVMERWTVALTNGEPFEMVFPLRSASGDFHPFLTRVQPVRNAAGAVTRWFGTNTDISDQQRAEDALRATAETLERRVAERTAALQANERRLRTMFETSFAFQGLITPEGIVLDANKTSLEGIASTLDDVAGKPFWNSPWFSGTPGVPEDVRAAIPMVAAGETVRQELTVDLPIGRRTFDLSLRPMLDDDGRVVAIMPEGMDVTERRLAEEALRQSQKLEAMGQLTGGVAHDFNNLLTPIIGALDILQRRGGGDARLARLIDGALQSAERAKTLVQRLLGFARRQSLQIDAVDLGHLLKEVCELIKISVGAQIDLQFEIEPDLPAVLADANQLELAILNLSVNARDAMPGGGTLTLGVEAATAGASASLGLTTGAYLRLWVQDSGRGMDAETLARAIEPFFSTKPTGQGTGLGLSMVHGLAAQLGGGFTLESSPGGGTCASLYLPVASDTVLALEKTPGGPTAASGAALRVLLVDDEDLVRRGTGEMLRDLGHAVTEARGGADALEIAGAGPDAFDLLITDYRMPGMNGADLARRMAAVTPGMPVLVITGYTGAEDEGSALPQLAKPFRRADLAEAISAVMVGSRTPGASPAL